MPISYQQMADLAVIIVALYYMKTNSRQGFLIAAAELLVFVVSFFGSLMLYRSLAETVVKYAPSVDSYAKPLAFMLSWGLLQVVLGYGAEKLAHALPRKIQRNILNRLFGWVPSLIGGVMVASVLAATALTMPITAQAKHAISDSQIAGPLTKQVAQIDRLSSAVSGQVFNTLTFFTVNGADKTEFVKLKFTYADGQVSNVDEKKIFDLVNSERQKTGLPVLKWDEKIAEIARKHAQDMLKRGYFSHLTPEGLTPEQRGQDGGAKFFTYGENIALVVNFNAAHEGFMNSPKHRENILRPEFGRLGVGVIAAGKYGIVVVQNFAD